MKKVVFTEEQIQDICDKYQNDHLGMSKIGTIYGVSKTVIARVLKENKIKSHQDNHVYKANYRKFQNIDSPEKAYWLGFIAADGCVYTRERNSSVIIGLHQKDEKHLEKFRDFMDSNVRITRYINDTGYSTGSPSPMCKIVFNSILMAEDIISHGIVPRKSLILQPPKIKEEFYLPYILGYFDGDGTIYKFNNDTEYCIGFIGSYDTITWINQILKLNATIEQRDKGSKTYYIRCGGTNKPYQILKNLYDSVDIHLDRKFQLFKELENVVLSRNAE